MSASSTKKDPCWKYSTLKNPQDVNTITCNFCGKDTKGGIYRAKQHLVGGFRNATACKKCPEHVKEEIREYMLRRKEEKDNSNLVLNCDSFEFGEDEEEEDVAIVSSHGKRQASSSVSSKTNTVPPKKLPKQKGPMDMFCTPDPEKVVQKRKAEKGQQTTINDAYKKEVRERACKQIARWIYDAGIPFNAVKYDSFAAAVEAIGQFGPGMKPPSYHEIRVPLLKNELDHTDNLMKDYREEWAKHGCSLMADGWKDKRERTLINFLVNCSKGTMFVESIDASAYAKTGEKMFQLLDNFIQKVGEKMWCK